MFLRSREEQVWGGNCHPAQGSPISWKSFLKVSIAFGNRMTIGISAGVFS